MSCTVSFERIGRNHNVPDLVTSKTDPEDIAYEIWHIARRNCGSRDLEVIVDLEARRGNILAGMRNAGSFTITEVVEAI